MNELDPETFRKLVAISKMTENELIDHLCTTDQWMRDIDYMAHELSIDVALKNGRKENE